MSIQEHAHVSRYAPARARALVMGIQCTLDLLPKQIRRLSVLNALGRLLSKTLVRNVQNAIRVAGNGGPIIQRTLFE